MTNGAAPAASSTRRSAIPPAAWALIALAYLAVSAWSSVRLPNSLFAFLFFLSSLFLLYYAPVATVLRVVLGAVALLLLMPVIGASNAFYLEVATQVGIFVALALGLNIVVGLAGLLDLGYVAFFAVGAYLWAVMGSAQATVAFGIAPLASWWFFPFLVLSVVAAGVAGVMLGLPVLRLRGDYLAIVTLGFGEVIRVLANNLDKPINFTNGPQGISPVGRPPLFFLDAWNRWLAGMGRAPWEESAVYPFVFYFLVIAVVAVVILVTHRVEDSHVGRAWTAIREDEAAAVTMGIPLVRMKLLAFATGASFAGVMGMLFASKQYFINPESFTFMESIGVLAMVILGGMGNIPGAILGASLVTILNLQVLKDLSIWLNGLRQAGTIVTLPIIGSYNLASLPAQLEPAKYERMVFGVILILMMIFRPQGILPSRRRARELHDVAAAGEVATNA
ncbi:MAG: branched-chain amino acid ABC transporter permease [Armatimonadetes bacterium]|nr:branched-chain amino acid ABC transporter permease [Armatimonadota bacterium]